MNRKRLVIFFLIGYLIAIAYPLRANYLRFKKVSILPPYRATFPFLYSILFAGRYPELGVDYYGVDLIDFNIYNKVISEYFFYAKDKPEQIGELEKKYQSLFLEKVKADPLAYIGVIGRNIIWMWDKRFLYPYKDPFYPKDKLVIRTLNIFILTFFGLGLIAFLKRNIKRVFQTPFVMFTLLLFIYITLALSLVTNETRVTIPFYPLLAVWAGYGVYRLKIYLQTWKLRSKVLL